MKQKNKLKTIHILIMFFFVFLPLSGCSNKRNSNVSAIPEELYTNSVGMKMIKLSTGYFVSEYETRQADFEKVMRYNLSYYKDPNRPVESLTYDEAEEFCYRLTELDRKKGILPSGYSYNLPTYQQWCEYVQDAPLAGSITPTGLNRKDDDITSFPVGSGEKNKLGLYDLRGNVTEYSADISESTKTHILLGADYNEYRPDFLDAYNKAYNDKPYTRSSLTGFRCVLSKDSPIDANETSIFAQAVSYEDVNSIQIDSKNINLQNKWGDTALIKAVLYDNYPTVKLLIEKGADVNISNNRGWLPLHFACLKDNSDYVKILLENGSRVDQGTVIQRENPLHLAVMYGSDDSVKLLLDKGASTKARDGFMWTPLHHAADLGQVEKVRLLLEAKANPNTSGNSWTPLDCADSNEQIIELLLKYGAN